MAAGIIIHITVGGERRTEFFAESRVRIGGGEFCDLQIHTAKVKNSGIWLDLENSEGIYRIVDLADGIGMILNENPVRRYVALADGDVISIPDADISFAFFSLTASPSLIRTNRDQPHISRFIEDAALESAASVKRDDAKAFLREFTRELMREVSWTTKLIILVLVGGFLSGILYIGYAVNKELRQSREQSEAQSKIISDLQKELGNASSQLSEVEKSNRSLIRTVSLAPELRVAYGNAVCLIVGVYDLVDKRSGKVLRYSDPSSLQANPYEPSASEDPSAMPLRPQLGITTEGDGSPIEYDFIGTGFYVGNGYLVTNRHVVQPWTEDDQVKQMMAAGNGRARLKRLVAYFPGSPTPYAFKVKATGGRDDIAIATLDTSGLPANLPIVPLDTDSDSTAVGKTVVTMGYPSGPDRLLAMVDDDEAKSINQRFGNSRQNLINFLAQSQKIVPLLTQGQITDLDSRRIVHDAKTAEGGSGAPLFGQAGKVIGVNFGVFTENTAANMAVPVRFVLELLKRNGWTNPSDQTPPSAGQTATAENSNSAPQAKTGN